MKNRLNLKYIFAFVFVLTALFISISCEEEKFNFDILPTHFDGIQNLDEEGVDCGGSSSVACPSCTDGIQNADETGIDCGGDSCPECPIGTPRADALASSGLPYYFTFEANDAGTSIEPFHTNTDGTAYDQGVDISYGVANPDGTANDLVAQVIRPDDGRFGGFEDYKFQPLTTPLDFSVYHKWTMEVYIPSGQDFSGSLNPEVVLILMDYETNFWERWTEIPITIDEANFDSWVTLEFDGTDLNGANGIRLQDQTTYTTIALRFGGGGHTESGTFYVRDLVPTTEDFGAASTTPRADALASSGLPYYFTFEANDAGTSIEPFHTNTDGTAYDQGVDISYGVANPDGTANDLVAQVIRPDDGRFGGFEDYKFQPLTTPLDFSVYHKWTMEVYIPSGQDFSGSLNPEVVLILMDYETNFWERWTEIPITIDEANFDSWVTLEFDGTDLNGANGIRLQDQTTYTTIALRFGGGGHTESGTFYVRDLKPKE